MREGDREAWGRLVVERMKGKTEEGGPVRRKRNSNPGEAAVFFFQEEDQ